MAIAVPGRTLPRRKGRRFARSRAVSTLVLTPLLDLLLAIVLFLLGMTSLSSGCGKRHRLIGVENARSMIEAPFVVVGTSQISLDGIAAGDTRVLVETGRVTVIAELRDRLKGKRELWRMLHPGRDFPGEVVLEVDRRVPAIVVKSALRSASAAGYSGIAFAVRLRGDSRTVLSAG
jgi:biopolymer transport protein ExbD